MSTGKIIQIIGAVVDVEFPKDSVPKIYDAIKVAKSENSTITMEVQQQIVKIVNESKTNPRESPTTHSQNPRRAVDRNENPEKERTPFENP